MADEMMVLIRFGGDADDLLPRYLGAVKRWREDEATKDFAPPLHGGPHEDRGRPAGDEPLGN